MTVNLTQTNGNVAAPFQSGGLVPSAMTTFRDGSFLSSLAPSAGGAAHAFRFGPRGIEARGAAQLAPIARGANLDATTPADLLVPNAGGDLLLAGGDGLPVIAAPSGLTLSTSVIAAAGAYRAFFAEAAGLRALVIHIPGVGLLGFPATGMEDAVLTTAGSLVLDGISLDLITSGGSRTLSSGASDRVVLSGQGTR